MTRIVSDGLDRKTGVDQMDTWAGAAIAATNDNQLSLLSTMEPLDETLPDVDEDLPPLDDVAL